MDHGALWCSPSCRVRRSSKNDFPDTSFWTACTRREATTRHSTRRIHTSSNGPEAKRSSRSRVSNLVPREARLSKCFVFFMMRWICLAIFHKNQCVATPCANPSVHRRQPKILKVETEVGQRRRRLHPHFSDIAVHAKAEGDECIAVERAVVPLHQEGVVCPRLHDAGELGGLAEGHAQLAALLRHTDIAVPGIAIGTSILR